MREHSISCLFEYNKMDGTECSLVSTIEVKGERRVRVERLGRLRAKMGLLMGYGRRISIWYGEHLSSVCIEEFKMTLDTLELLDLPLMGCKWTWSYQKINPTYL